MNNITESQLIKQIIPDQNGTSSLGLNKSSGDNNSNCGVTLNPQEKEEIIQRCVIEVLRTLKRKSER